MAAPCGINRLSNTGMNAASSPNHGQKPCTLAGRVWQLALTILLTVTVVGALFAFDPAACHWLFPPCLFRSVTGWCCPGCGSTRALHALLHGHVVTAFFFNPLAVILLPALFASLLYARCSGRWPSLLQRRWVYWFVLTTVLAFGIMRNVPLYPFTLFGQ